MEPKKRSKLIQTVLLGTCIHILLLFVVFDTFFKSPLEKGMSAVKSSDNPSSKRIVIFIADGLRAHAILDNNENSSAFLTSIRKTRGAWGISHTRVPTESRPNHVAILGGIYEDPSAVFKSWQDFPIDFDTVFNESKNAWVIGSVEVVRLFNKDNKTHIKIIPLPTEMENFGTKNQTILDQWVFDQMTSLLQNPNETKIHQSGNIFSLHLCGLDMTGHSQKPNSKQYFENIQYVDNNIKKIEDLIEKTFQDNSTTFIFTSDHGMTDWGSHGSGSDHETFTPFIAWGAGININKTRQDIDQIDIAPMISALLGLNYPINSIGKLPVQYLNQSEKEKTQLLKSNIEQIYRIFEMKQRRLELQSFAHGPFMTPEKFNRNISKISNSTNQTFGDILLCYDASYHEILDGINYFNNFFMIPILCFIFCGLFFWILYLFMTLISDAPDSSLKEKRLLGIAVLLGFFMFIGILQTFPTIYYLYIIFPIVSIYLFANECRNYSHTMSLEVSSLLLFKIVYFSVCIIAFILSFYYRFCFSITILLVSYTVFFQKRHKYLKYSWIMACLLLSIFPLLPVMFTDFHILHFLIGYISWQYLIFYLFIMKKYERKGPSELTYSQKIIFIILNSCLSLGFLIAISTSTYNIKNHQGHKIEDTLHIKYLSWLIFLLPLSLVPFSMPIERVRMLTILMAFAPFYMLTTMSYEMIFLTFYSVFLMLWMKIENNSDPEVNESLENFRKSLIYIALILIGYFGTGNIVSISSFDPMWVRCFVTSFDPFKIMSLIFLKHTLPIFYATFVFRNIILGTSANLTECFYMVLLIFDLMVMYFLFDIKNVGSWATIGASLSRFIVVDCLTMGLIFFYFVAYFLENVHIPLKF